MKRNANIRMTFYFVEVYGVIYFTGLETNNMDCFAVHLILI